MGQAAPRVMTIGHSTREFDEVVRMLRSNGVTELVDVRSFPNSRKFPQWNQATIEGALPAGIGYRWIRDLGGRRHTPAGTETPNDGWKVKAFRDYADYMSTEAFAAGLAELLAVASCSVPAIMCSEAVPWRCHRRLVTDALIVAGVEVLDIMSPGTTRRAKLTSFAQVQDGKITYPATEGE
ncbi:DNA repair protein [Arthrobacter sp. UCD-GKA]|nr:DNA repair protein [Arthrobacter sp. UCD-GKA]